MVYCPDSFWACMPPQSCSWMQICLPFEVGSTQSGGTFFRRRSFEALTWTSGTNSAAALMFSICCRVSPPRHRSKSRARAKTWSWSRLNGRLSVSSGDNHSKCESGSCFCTSPGAVCTASPLYQQRRRLSCTYIHCNIHFTNLSIICERDRLGKFRATDAISERSFTTHIPFAICPQVTNGTNGSKCLYETCACQDTAARLIHTPVQ